MYQAFGKRLFDLVGASLLTLITLPLQIVVASLVRLKLGSPVIFAQERPGKDGKPFKLHKFRTMTDERDQAGRLLPDGERLTPFGEFLRSSSLDELPELADVIRGDMSLVGPRPLLMSYLDRYTSAQARRHEVRPGVTGLAQVSGRNELSWEEKFNLDLQYVDNVSFRMDLRILLLTALGVLRRSGIHAQGHATAPEFMGSVDSTT